MSILHRLPRELRKEIASYLEDLRKLRLSVRSFFYTYLMPSIGDTKTMLECDLLLDKQRLEACLDMKKFMCLEISRRTVMHSAIVQIQSAALFRFFTRTTGRWNASPQLIFRIGIKHKIRLQSLIALIDDCYNTVEWPSLKETILMTFNMMETGTTACECCDHINPSLIQDIFPILRHCIIMKKYIEKTRLYDTILQLDDDENCERLVKLLHCQRYFMWSELAEWLQTQLQTPLLSKRVRSRYKTALKWCHQEVDPCPSQD